MKKTLCHQIPASEISFGVKLEQTGYDSFTVTYGQQVKRGLSYGEAATEYGAAIMHALTCDGMIAQRD